MDFRLPRWHELPDIDLYLDQVISLIDKWLADMIAGRKKTVMTRTMINNYVKQKIIPAPVNKRYEKRSVAALIIVAYLKSVYAIPDIARLIAIVLDTDDMETGYDRFCGHTERAVRRVFGGDAEPADASGPQGRGKAAGRAKQGNEKTSSGDAEQEELDRLMSAVADSFACQLYVMKEYLNK